MAYPRNTSTVNAKRNDIKSEKLRLRTSTVWGFGTAGDSGQQAFGIQSI